MRKLKQRLQKFLLLCDPTAVAIYGPYPPTADRERWRIVVVEGKKRKAFTAPTQEAAHKLIKVIEAELRQQTPLSVHNAIDQYLAYKTHSAGEGWLRTLGDRLRCFLPDIPVTQISEDRAQALYEAETTRVGRLGVVKAATHQALLRNTKEFFRWLIKKNFLTANPFDKVDPIGKANRRKLQPRKPEVLKLEAVLFEHARAGNEGALALLVQIYVGLRSSEVLRLVCADIEIEAGRYYLTVLPGPTPAERLKTDNAARRLEVFEDVGELLVKHTAGRPGSQRVFAAHRPKRPASTSLHKKLRSFCRKAGISPVCPHALRGLHSTLAVEAGATTHDVARSLGHGSDEVTRRHYIQPAAIMNSRVHRVVSALRSKDLAAEVDRLSEEEKTTLRKLLGTA